MNQILVTGYVNPDLDAIACATAYVEFLQKTGKDAIAGIIGEPQEEARFICDRFGISSPPRIQNVDGYSQVILVDTSELVALEGNIPPEKVIEIIDHRKIHEVDKFPNARAQIELVGSASTLIAEKFIRQDIAISKESAILLCGAILSNTFNFKGGVTTQRDKDVYKWLNQFALLSENFWRELFIAKSDMSGDRLEERMRSDFAWYVFGNKKFGIAQLEIMGARKLIDERKDEIVELLNKIKSEMNLDFIFQNTVALDEEKNFFIADDSWTQHLLEKVLNIQFQGVVAERQNLIMRKQIIPLLKEELERNMEVDILAKTVWDYMLLHHELKPMDAIFVLGSNDTRVAERAAELYLQGYGAYVICAGGNGKESRFPRSEAETFADIVIAKGVPKDKVILESASLNTGENILFVKKLLADLGLHLKSFILVQKPYMERRTYATFRKQWPEAECIVTSPQISFEEYAKDEDFKRRYINVMVGDLLRIREYPKRGFQIEQEIPKEVWDAGQILVQMGFNKYVLRD